MRAIGHRLLKLRERGDTIVEVLISIAVISLILGGAYVTTQRSLLASRDAQERGNALKLSEGQLEQLKNIASSGSASTIFGGVANGTFCVASNGSLVDAGNAGCAVDSAGQPTGQQPVYHLTITRGGNTFTIKTTWDSLLGGTDNVQLMYRLYQ